MWWQWLVLTLVGLVIFFGGAVIAVVAFRLGVKAARGEDMALKVPLGKVHMRSVEQEAQIEEKLTTSSREKEIAKFMKELQETR